MKPEHRPNYNNTVTHLKEFINPREAKRIVEMSVRHLRKLEKNGLEFTTIAFRGLSGALIAPMIAMKMDKSLLAVRKVKRTGHGSNAVEGDYNAGNYIIVDDFIATGETCREIMQEIEEECYAIRCNCATAYCVGVLQAYHFVHPEFRDFQGHPDIFDRDVANSWHVQQGTKRREQARVQNEERMKTEQAIAKLRESPRCEVSMKEEYRWEPQLWDYETQTYSLNSLLVFVGLPPEPKKLSLPAPKSPLKNYVEKEKARLAKLKSDRDNFNARTATGRQRLFPRITSSSLRSISR
jgi:hypothetical protein